MRKQYKRKARSCGLCKPHKRGLENRWTPHQRQTARDAAREMREAGSRLG